MKIEPGIFEESVVKPEAIIVLGKFMGLNVSKVYPKTATNHRHENGVCKIQI